MKKRILEVAVVALAIALIATSAYAVWVSTISRNMHFSMIKTYGIEIYSDSACTTLLTDADLDYDFTDTGQEQSVTAYLKNNGNYPANVSYTATGFAAWQDGTQKWLALDAVYMFRITFANGTNLKAEQSSTPTWIPIVKGASQEIRLVVQSNNFDPAKDTAATVIFHNNNGEGT